MIFIDKCLKKQTPFEPVWMMRQAGRYLPQYRATRAKAGDFISLCKNPALASEVTLQPVSELDVDAAILFSDILVVPMELGLSLKFVAGEGPVFENPVRKADDLARLNLREFDDRLQYVYDAIALTRQNLPSQKALIGFCGAPWTIATYIIEGAGSKNYSICKRLLYENPALMHEILALITQASKRYLERQIRAGVDAVQIFDSWAGALEESAYFEFSWAYIREICDFLKAKFPQVPIIVFPKGISGFLEKIDGNFDVFGVDWATPMRDAVKFLGDKYVLQGNLEPCRLYSQSAIKSGVEEILKATRNAHHIFNLGHGILPDAPVENAKYFVDLAHLLSKK